MLAPTTLSMPRGMWGEPYRMGVNGAHNTVEGNIGVYNTVCVRAVVEYCSVQGMIPGTVV